jgi:hypothetical protein
MPAVQNFAASGLDVQTLLMLIAPLPCVGLLALAILEVFSWHVAADPQRVFSWQATLSRRYDSWHRTSWISGLYANEVSLSVYVLVYQSMLLTFITLPATGSTYIIVWLGILLVAYAAASRVYPAIIRQNGRLGGRLTGWPWQPVPVAAAVNKVDS